MNPKFIALLAICIFSGCGDKPLPPIPELGNKGCINSRELMDPQAPFSGHLPERIKGILVKLPGLDFASGAEVESFFGTRKVKLTFVIGEALYLVSWENGGPEISRISQADESPDRLPAYIYSPLFSPDGKWITFQTAGGASAFLRQANPGETLGWRIPLNADGYQTADPHFYQNDSGTFIVFAQSEEALAYLPNCKSFEGYTYRVKLLNDSTVGNTEPTGYPGAFRGGISRDGKWVGTTYSATGLWSRETPEIPPVLLANGEQKCNASMNPFPAGSRNTDLIMLLAFGGNYPTVSGTVHEGLHQNIWIYSSRDKAVAQIQLPDTSKYYLWDKPEWSTHPRFATGVAARIRESEETALCDLFVVKLPDLGNQSLYSLNQAETYFRIAKGGFNRSTYSHLWVGLP